MNTEAARTAYISVLEDNAIMAEKYEKAKKGGTRQIAHGFALLIILGIVLVMMRPIFDHEAKSPIEMIEQIEIKEMDISIFKK